MPPNGVKGFLNDYTLITSKEDTHTPATCQQCEDNNNAVAYCNTCSHICDKCLTAHKEFKVFHLHEIVSYESDNQESESEITVQLRKAYYCTVHPQENLKFYCKTCLSLVCVYCFVNNHNGHDIGSIDDKIRQEVEQSINDLVKETDSKLTEFTDNMKYISAVEKEKAEISTLLKVEVDKKVDCLIQQLEVRRKELHKEIDDACTKDLKELWAQKEYHETAITSMEGALSFARRALARKEDTELLALCAQVTSRLKELSQLKWDIQETEKIEACLVNWTPETSDEVSVGKIVAHTSVPTIKIEPIEMSNTFISGERVAYNLMVAFANTPKNFQLREHHDLKISGSASCDGSRNMYSFTQRRHLPQHFTENVAVDVVKCQNEWTVSFFPSSGTTRITLNLTASGQYCYQSVSATLKVYLCQAM